MTQGDGKGSNTRGPAHELREYYGSLLPKPQLKAEGAAKQIGEEAARYMLLRQGKRTEHLRARALNRMRKLCEYFRAQNVDHQ